MKRLVTANLYSKRQNRFSVCPAYFPNGGLIKGLSSKTAPLIPYLASVHLDPALGEELDRLGKDLMLEFEYPLRQRFLCVIVL